MRHALARDRFLGGRAPPGDRRHAVEDDLGGGDGRRRPSSRLTEARTSGQSCACLCRASYEAFFPLAAGIVTLVRTSPGPIVSSLSVSRLGDLVELFDLDGAFALGAGDRRLGVRARSGRRPGWKG